MVRATRIASTCGTASAASGRDTVIQSASFSTTRHNGRPMTMSLFEGPSNIELSEEPVGPGATILRSFAISEETEIQSAISDVVSKAPFRYMITPGGFRLSVAMTNCGALGWVTDRTGYRYDPMDPESGLPWPPMPESFLTLATNAAAKAGFKEFVPDACLINQYDPGARLTLHQDKERAGFRPTYRLRAAGTVRHTARGTPGSPSSDVRARNEVSREHY